MLRGATPRAEEMVGTAVLRIVVSSDSIKNATATSHGRSRLEVSEGLDEDGGAINGPAWFICRNCGRLRRLEHVSRSVRPMASCMRVFRYHQPRVSRTTGNFPETPCATLPKVRRCGL